MADRTHLPLAPRGTVLVLDADQPAALAVLRSLARRGLRVEVASTDARAIGRRSRHASACWCHPDPLADSQAFVQWLQNHVRTHVYGLVIPLTERTVVPLSQQRDGFAPGLISVADADALAQVIDKQRTVALAAALDIPVPLAEPVHDADQAVRAARLLGYPVVVKPARSVGSQGGQRVQLSVSYAFDDRELVAQVESALRYGPVMLQEYFAGDGVGIELIADRGEVKYTFQHRRLHEVPLTGGGSSLRISESPHPDLVDAAGKLMRALRWHGVAMVEFKRNPASGAFRLMEINGRFWGSLPLAVAAGADFPAMLHALMTTGEVGTWPAARPGIVGRQLARDLDWLEHVLRRNAPARLVQLPSAGQVLRDSLLVFSPQHRFDVQSWRDPWPGLVDLARIAGGQLSRVAGKLAQRRRLRQERQRATALHRQWAKDPQPPRVLFLCYGNINRSALAQVYAQGRLSAPERFESAGFHARHGRPADSVMVGVAHGLGVRLDTWQSQTVDAAMVRRADLILAMEVAHLDRLLESHPEARDRACLLDGATPSAEIPDPYGLALSAYEQVARRICTAVDRWFPHRIAIQRQIAAPVGTPSAIDQHE